MHELQKNINEEPKLVLNVPFLSCLEFLSTWLFQRQFLTKSNKVFLRSKGQRTLTIANGCAFHGKHTLSRHGPLSTLITSPNAFNPGVHKRRGKGTYWLSHSGGKVRTPEVIFSLYFISVAIFRLFRLDTSMAPRVKDIK
jgi:hypothetical protein